MVRSVALLLAAVLVAACAGEPGIATRSTAAAEPQAMPGTQTATPASRSGTLPSMTPTSLTAAPAGGWSWFGDPRAVYHDGVTYFGYVNNSGDIVISAYTHATQAVSSTTLHSALQIDDHANPSVLIRDSDKRIMAFYTAHAGATMYLRVSANPLDISTFATEVDLGAQLGGTKYTYPNVTQLTGEAGDPIYLFYREGNWLENSMRRSTSADGGATWSAGTAIYSAGAGRGAYWKLASNGVDRIDFGVTDGHPTAVDAVSTYHFYYTDGAFFSTVGTEIEAAHPFAPTHLTQVYDGTAIESWIWDVACDPSTGHPRLTFVTFPSVDDHRYQYAAWDGAAWAVREIVAGGSDIYGDTNQPTQPNYSGGVVLDHVDPNVAYASVQDNGQWEIVRFTTHDGGQTFRSAWLTAGSSVKNIRPVSVRNHDGTLPVVWMRGDYTAFTEWNTGTWGIRMDRPPSP